MLFARPFRKVFRALSPKKKRKSQKFVEPFKFITKECLLTIIYQKNRYSLMKFTHDAMKTCLDNIRYYSATNVERYEGWSAYTHYLIYKVKDVKMRVSLAKKFLKKIKKHL